MAIDLSLTQFTSSTSTLKNGDNITGSYYFAGTTLTPSAFTSFDISNVIDNTNAIADYQIRYTGLETFWRTLEGFIYQDFPSYAAPDYQIITMSYFTGTTLTIKTIIASQNSGSSVVVPAFTLDYRINLYNAPF